jgi:glycosyltransferase involved in cell wall biosynthesis
MIGLNSDRVELHLATALKDAGVDLYAITEPSSIAEKLCLHRDIPFSTHHFRSRVDARAIRLYRRLLKEEKPDIFHCLTNRALSNALLATRRGDSPKIVAYRGTMGHLHRLDPASWLSYLHPRVDAIICVSDAVRRYLKTFNLPDHRLTVIWKGHDPAWYDAPAPRSVLHEFGIPADAVVVCLLGNIRPVKGADVLLQAFQDIRPNENIHLLLIGEVRDKRIARQKGRHPCVHFLGYRSDAARLAGACDIATMPSVEREGLPKAIIEAMVQGIPAVVTNVGGMPELVQHGISGIVVPPRDPAALREAFRTLAADAALRRQYGIHANARIEGPFQFRHTVEKTLTLYRKLLS